MKPSMYEPLSSKDHVLRRSLLFLIVASAEAAQSTVASAQSAESPGMRLVATVPQMGPVGYRDPLGVVSPNGEWLAFTSGDAINAVKTAGDPIRSLAAGLAIARERARQHTGVVGLSPRAPSGHLAACGSP